MIQDHRVLGTFGKEVLLTSPIVTNCDLHRTDGADRASVPSTSFLHRWQECAVVSGSEAPQHWQAATRLRHKVDLILDVSGDTGIGSRRHDAITAPRPRASPTTSCRALTCCRPDLDGQLGSIGDVRMQGNPIPVDHRLSVQDTRGEAVGPSLAVGADRVTAPIPEVSIVA